MRFLPLALLWIATSLHAAPDVRAISVSGQCMRRVTADRGAVTLVAQFKDKNASVAAKKAADTYEKLRAAVQKLKLKDLELQTTEYTIQENFDHKNGRSISNGTQASMGLQVVTSEISRLGEVTALAPKFDIQRAEGLMTFLSREKSKAQAEECLIEAIQNARDKAAKMAKAADSSVGEVLSIDENGAPSNPMPMMAKSMMMADAVAESAPRIESRSEEIQVSVLVKFALK